MKKLIILAIIGFLIALLLGILHYFFKNIIILETFKIFLSLSLLTIGGIVIKAIVDKTIEKERNKLLERNRHEEMRKTILNEFAEIYSEFYSARKLYHSARSHENIYKKDSPDYNALLREILKKSVDLEGRYGALKISVITHFDLPRGDYQTKNISKLINEIKTADGKTLARLRLDLLGEYFDDWRHSIERDTKIKSEEEFWNTYDFLLKFVEKS